MIPPLLIFDFDGTLVDTAPDIISATNELLDELGLPSLSDEQIKINIGQGLSDLLMHVLPVTRTDLERRAQIIDRFIKIYENHYLTSPKLYEGVEVILREWPNKKAILSNKAERFIRSILQHIGLADIPWTGIIGGDTFATKKPDPEGLNYLLKQANLKIDDAVLIGDGNPDADLAASTGIQLFACEFGYGEIDELMRRGGSVRLRHYNDLKSLMETTQRCQNL